MNRTLRFTLIMAILGFILGLGFLVPLGSQEARGPANSTAIEERVTAFLPPAGPLVTVPETEAGTPAADPRPDVLFDVHTISKSRYAKNTDAFVYPRFRSSARDEIDDFVYCHNYDYENQHADTRLNRYQLGGANGFPCSSISLTELAAGYSLISTPLGEMLTLKSTPGFNSRTGGTISMIFAYRVVKIKFGGRSNDYRRFDLNFTLRNGVATIAGPARDPFNWIDLTMSEDFLWFPDGVESFQLSNRGLRGRKYMGSTFPKTADSALK